MICYKSLLIEKKGVAKKIAIGKRFCFNFLFIFFWKFKLTNASLLNKNYLLIYYQFQLPSGVQNPLEQIKSWSCF